MSAAMSEAVANYFYVITLESTLSSSRGNKMTVSGITKASIGSPKARYETIYAKASDSRPSMRGASTLYYYVEMT